MAIEVGPPNSGPEPEGLMQAVREKMFGAPPAGAPDPYQLLLVDANAIKLLTETRKFCDPGREAFEWGWWRALLYFLGRHWIYWNPQSRTWNDKRLARWVPKPVTNKIRETYDSIFALLSDITPGINCRPVGNEPKNVIAAETADEMAPLIHDEHAMTEQMGFADFWAILLGNAFLHPHWDKDDLSNRQVVTLWQCNACKSVLPPTAIMDAGNKCPNCGSTALRAAVDPTTQQPMTQSVIVGKGKTLVVSPLELLIPLYAQSFAAVDRLIFTSWLPRHEIEDELADQPDALKKIQWTQSPQQRSLQLYRSLAMQTDLPMSPQVWNTQTTMSEVEGATVQHLWVKAGKRYDRGVYLKFYGEGENVVRSRVANSENGEEPIIPYTSLDGAPLWPWIHYPYKRVTGRLYAQGAVDPILQKNDQINQIDSMTQLVANRMGNPIWLEPKGSEVERFTGEPGLIVRWQPVGSQGAKPERIGGENPPQSFFALRQQFLADIEDLSGTYDVVKGAKPSGVEAFSALQLLVERSQSRFTPVFKARGEAYRQWFEVAIELERMHGPGERVRNVLGPNRSWTQQIFENTKLQGAISIVVEDGSNVPKTALGRRAAIEHANTLGLLTPQQNPDQQYAMMTELGVSNLVPSLDADVKSALQEQQAFEDWIKGGGAQKSMQLYQQQMGQFQQQQRAYMATAAANPQGPQAMPPQPPQIQSPLQRMPWHNDQVHLNENRKWMNSDRIREILGEAGPMSMFIVQTLAQHLNEHQQAVMMMQAQQQQAQAEIAGREPEGSGRGMRDSNANSKPQPPRSGAA